jgi:hypothetical protein
MLLIRKELPIRNKNTRMVYYQAIGQFLDWLTEKGVLAMNPAREVKTPKFSRTEGQDAGVQHRGSSKSPRFHRNESRRRPSGESCSSPSWCKPSPRADLRTIRTLQKTLKPDYLSKFFRFL